MGMHNRTLEDKFEAADGLQITDYDTRWVTNPGNPDWTEPEIDTAQKYSGISSLGMYVIRNGGAGNQGSVTRYVPLSTKEIFVCLREASGGYPYPYISIFSENDVTIGYLSPQGYAGNPIYYSSNGTGSIDSGYNTALNTWYKFWFIFNFPEHKYTIKYDIGAGWVTVANNVLQAPVGGGTEKYIERVFLSTRQAAGVWNWWDDLKMEYPHHSLKFHTTGNLGSMHRDPGH